MDVIVAAVGDKFIIAVGAVSFLVEIVTVLEIGDVPWLLTDATANW